MCAGAALTPESTKRDSLRRLPTSQQRAGLAVRPAGFPEEFGRGRLCRSGRFGRVRRGSLRAHFGSMYSRTASSYSREYTPERWRQSRCRRRRGRKDVGADVVEHLSATDDRPVRRWRFVKQVILALVVDYLSVKPDNASSPFCRPASIVGRPVIRFDTLFTRKHDFRSTIPARS